MKLIYCMVSKYNSYMYDVDGCYTDDLDVLEHWVECGINSVVVLDAYSLGIIANLTDTEQIIEFIENNR